MLGIPNSLTSGVLYPREPIWGIGGTGQELAIKSGAGRLFYVDSGHADANDNNDGLEPNHPKATLASAIASPFLSNYDTIFVSGTVTESIVTPDYVTGPSYVRIVGTGVSQFGPQWDSGAADAPCLDLRAPGWRIEGFRFYGPTTEACIQLRHTDTGANDIAIRTIIKDCYFDGSPNTTALYGIETHGCYDVWVVGCQFAFFHNGGGTGVAIRSGTTPLAIPYRNKIIGCQFYENDNHVYVGMNASIVQDNVFQAAGKVYSATIKLRTTDAGGDGNNNLVVGNYLPGDYSVAGGYVGAATDEWIGNFASDIAEAEVGDNGITILPPA